MKNIVKSIFLSLVFLLVIIAPSCNQNLNNNNSVDNEVNEKPGIEEKQEWFLLYDIKYNTAYSSYGEGQGFFIYDEIDLNDVNFSSNVDKFTVKYDISYGEEKTIIGIGANSKFRVFVFSKAGQYTIKVSGKDNNGKALTEGEFKCNVVVGDRPDRIEYVIKNSNQEIVEYIKGGDSYTIVANLFNQEKEYIPLKQDIYWNAPGISQYNLNLGNIFKQESIKTNLYCYVYNNNNSRIQIFADESFIIYDNLEKTPEFPQGIYFDLGEDISNGELELNVDSAMEGFFYKKIKAEYRFDNGETMNLKFSDERLEGKLGMYISYDQETPEIYSVKNYDYSIDAKGNKKSNYFSNGVEYQFEPTKTAAKIYLAVWTLKNNQYITSKVEGTDINLKLISQIPSAITVDSVSGSHKNDNEAFMTGYKNFEKTPVNGAIDVYLCCDMDGDNKIIDEYEGKSLSSISQYFVLNVSSIGGNLNDYIVTYSYESWEYPAIKMQTFKTGNGFLERFFVAPNIGVATITVKSMFSEHEYMLTINVVDKVFEDAKVIQNLEWDEYSVFSVVDFSSILKIREYKLRDFDRDSYILRSPREDEVFEYSINGTIMEANAFSYQNNGLRGQEITVGIKGTNKKTTISKVYIIPDFIFSAYGVTYSLKDISETATFFESVVSKTDNDFVRWYYGLIPVLNLDTNGENINFEITNTLEMEKNEYDMPRYYYYTRSNTFVLEYIFYYTDKGLKQSYGVEILNINFS